MRDHATYTSIFFLYTLGLGVIGHKTSQCILVVLNEDDKIFSLRACLAYFSILGNVEEDIMLYATVPCFYPSDIVDPLA